MASDSTNLFCGAARGSVEKDLLNELSVDVPWELIERFSTLIRESGSAAEKEAAQFIATKLDEFGISHRVFNPELFLSVPVSASLEWGARQYRAKTPSFSASTPSGGTGAEVVYLSSTLPEGVGRLFHFNSSEDVNVRGKITVTDGYGFPDAVRHFEAQGAIGQIYINPGDDIHWGICTTIWGAPDLDSAHRQPRTPILAINHPDGEALKKQIQKEKTSVTIRTKLKEGWFSCPLIVADIQGLEEPERFLLVHGHYDSWDVGIGDNAVGDGTLLELARVFHRHRDKLARSLKIAWWPGHSTGRYGGSTWFADNFGLELSRNCIAQVDIDSPGCRWASVYEDISWMTEAADFCSRAIKDLTGKEAHGERPHQAGDYSFNNIGLTGFFMLLSTMPKELLLEKSYYPTGGCGGNIAWHTENDTLEIADRDNLMRDLRVYAATVQRVLNNPVHPFDFRRLADEFKHTLTRYSNAAAGSFDFSEGFQALERLTSQLDRFYAGFSKLLDKAPADPKVREVNDAILELGRILIPINYTRYGRFRNEPAVPVPPLPDLAPALELAKSAGHHKHVIRTHLQRGLNRVAWAFEQAARAVERVSDGSA